MAYLCGGMQPVLDKPLYCNSLTRYERWLTRVVDVGGIPLGGHHPIRIQSMTTTDTMDTAATVAQSVRMIEAGCEYVRITAPSIREAENLAAIRDALRKLGYRTPLIADIHYTPNAAEAAARIVEKVRVNPGNYADKKKFEVREYTDAAYAAELERIRDRFVPLVRICREYGTAMRIGTNHGSLSDRIMNRYGDTPLGMVESAMEFLRICEDEGYRSVVLSMKASNPLVMVQAYRLLVCRMKEGGMNYPLHLGVTEAGEGEDGRIKSAAGIATLLEDGLGDTIRVSLTEEPEHEIPVARTILLRYARRAVDQHPMPPLEGGRGGPADACVRRRTEAALNVGGKNVPRVIADLSHVANPGRDSFRAAGYRYDAGSDKWRIGDQAADFIYLGERTVGFAIPGTLGIIHPYTTWLTTSLKDGRYPLFTAAEWMGDVERSPVLNFIGIDTDEWPAGPPAGFVKPYPAVWVFRTSNPHAMPSLRRAFLALAADETTPAIIHRTYADPVAEVLQVDATSDTAGLLLDGFGDGLWLTAPAADPAPVNALAFGILQATRTRISKTEYISCPSCGRTLFDLQETTAKIRARTAHLKGVKIGIMGCIVNGPGEMADADYGYVGTGKGRITLYKGREVVTRNIPADQAVDALVQLIRDNGDWVEKE